MRAGSGKRDGGPTATPGDRGMPPAISGGETRTNATHVSTTDPDAKQYREGAGQPAVLGYLGHLLMDNRHGVVVDACVTPATGTAEREAALDNLPDILRAGSIVAKRVRQNPGPDAGDSFSLRQWLISTSQGTRDGGCVEGQEMRFRSGPAALKSRSRATLRPLPVGGLGGA